MKTKFHVESPTYIELKQRILAAIANHPELHFAASVVLIRDRQGKIGSAEVDLRSVPALPTTPIPHNSCLFHILLSSQFEEGKLHAILFRDKLKMTWKHLKRRTTAEAYANRLDSFEIDAEEVGEYSDSLVEGEQEEFGRLLPGGRVRDFDLDHYDHSERYEDDLDTLVTVQ